MNGAGYFTGEIEEVRIYNRALTGFEAGQLYSRDAGNMDQDGDGLTDAWERGFGRYQIVTGIFTWEQAQADAEAKGGHLATITSAAERDFVGNLVGEDLNQQDYWIGGSDRDQEGVWRWETDEAWNYTVWYPGEPNNGAGQTPYPQNYLAMVS